MDARNQQQEKWQEYDGGCSRGLMLITAVSADQGCVQLTRRAA
jgi:hypothetical protein